MGFPTRSVLLLSSLAGLLAGCAKGVGDPCAQSAECLPGLTCAAGACATCEGEACVAIDLVVRSCDPAANPLEGVTHLRVTVVGDNLPAQSVVSPIGNGLATISGIALGKNRRITVDGLDSGNPTTATVLSSGRSGLFDVDGERPLPAMTIFLRRQHQFSQTAVATAPTTCAALATPRAGHSATRLDDGTVLVAGGYSYDAEGKKVYLKSTELFDPRTGAFEVLTSQLNVGRSGHTSTLLPNGKVLLAGGSGSVNAKESGLASAELYDPQTRTFAFVRMLVPRMRHAAALLPSGVVVVSGGVPSAEDREPTDKTEYYNLSQNKFIAGPNLSGKRGSHASIALDAERVLVIGGTGQYAADGSALPAFALGTVDVIHSVSGTLILETTEAKRLAAPRPMPLVAAMPGWGGGVLVTGEGLNGGNGTTDAWDWIPATTQPAPTRATVQLPTGRTGACIAANDFGVLVIGGRNASGVLASADLYAADTTDKLSTSRLEKLSSARSGLACAVLADGSVLVTGGETEPGKAVSGAVDVYVP